METRGYESCHIGITPTMMCRGNILCIKFPRGDGGVSMFKLTRCVNTLAKF